MTYTIKDLKDLIKDLPDDMLVVLSSDEEGNSFSTVEAYDFGHYEEYDGEGDFSGWEDEDGTIEVAKKDANALLLWP